MKIIDKIEISYFRSVYTISMKNCHDINVITGGNDAGKSNILKALNLFFNNETEPHSDFEFLRDLSRYREVEARAQKGRMTIWIRITFNNFLGWKSLPKKFAIRRTWNRYEDLPTDTVTADIPGTTLGRFLAKIKFHYVPAVRSREIFSDLLGELHDTLVQDESAGLRQSSDALVSDLHELTKELSADIHERVKIESTIDLPESLADLFRALNFLTKFGDHDIPLTHRGDGLQSRHLPFILAYISEKSQQHHIWGYEEPENSLELSKAFEMAADFKEKFSTKNQIFLTTHSPAFYDLSGEQVAKWYAESRLENGITATQLTSLSTSNEIDETMGLLTVITPRMRDVYAESKRLRSSLHDMSQLLEEVDCPVVYLEGPTDCIILALANEHSPDGPQALRFAPAKGAGDITQFLKVSSRVKDDQRPLVGLFDADARGRKEFERFKANHLVPNTNFRIVDQGKRIFAGTLVLPAHLEEASKAFKELGLQIPVPVEFMFEREVIQEAIDLGHLSLKPRFAQVANEELPLKVQIDELLKPRLADELLYLAMEIDSDCKTGFAEWIAEQPGERFLPFAPTLTTIGTAVG
jgi:AAA domain, putative AbiEii toxin, Type IV TA system